MIAAKVKSESAPMSVFRKLRRILSRRRKEKLSRGGASPSVSPAIASQVSLHSVFSYFDANGDGKITPEELQTCVRTMGGKLTAEEAEAAVRSLDWDGDGTLGFDEFVQLMEGGGSGEELKEAFQIFETEDGRGITASSLKRMLRRLGEVWSIEDCKLMIREFDLDGNGVITLDEFLAMMR